MCEHDLHFVGAGISGGEVGALEGPSIMPGGLKDAYAALGPTLEDISPRRRRAVLCLPRHLIEITAIVLRQTDAKR